MLKNASAAISVEGLEKCFRIPGHRYATVKERVLHPFRTQTYRTLHTLEDIDFEVKKGEFFGIVGRNGSGKSTLLKCLAGIYSTDKGRIEVDGKLSTFIELGVGFNPELTARDNVLINAVMLGLSRKEAQERFDGIIAFAELEDFVDMKLKNYSSGMNVRLAFSVAIQVDAEILLIDEVLAVGDAAFQQKCYEQFIEMKRSGKTILFVTHDMGLVDRFCDRAMLIDSGELVEYGDPEIVAKKYHEINFGKLVVGGKLHASDSIQASHSERSTVLIDDAWCENLEGERIKQVFRGDKFKILFDVKFEEEVVNPIFGMTMRNLPRHTVFSTETTSFGSETGVFKAGETVRAEIELESWLAPSQYTLSFSVAKEGAGNSILALKEDFATFMAHSKYVTGGLIDPPHTFEIKRS